jgi:hypothetical protein
MSIGYCQTWVTNTLDPTVADTRTLLDSSLPERFKFLGFAFNPTLNNFQFATAKSFETFSLFDGSTSADPVVTFVLVVGAINTISGNSDTYLMLDDTYIQFNEGLYYEASTPHLSSASMPYNLTLMYS